MSTLPVGIFSDIHGNFFALKQVIACLKEKGCREMYCLGDVSGYYSMINECIELLRQEHVVTLKGNHDSYLLGETECPRSRSANDCIKYQRRIIRPDNMEWLSKLLPYLHTSRFDAVHGGWNDPLDEYIQSFDFEEGKKRGGALFFSGHTHVQKIEQKYGITYCNPGSVGQPRDYDWRAACAVLYDDDTVKLSRVEYDVDLTADAMKNAGFDSYYYRNLYYGCKIGENHE